MKLRFLKIIVIFVVKKKKISPLGLSLFVFFLDSVKGSTRNPTMKNKYKQPETSSMVCRRSFKYNRTSFHLGAGRPHPDQKSQPVKEKEMYNTQ